jgi:hypothetical protein
MGLQNRVNPLARALNKQFLKYDPPENTIKWKPAVDCGLSANISALAALLIKKTPSSDVCECLSQ